MMRRAFSLLLLAGSLVHGQQLPPPQSLELPKLPKLPRVSEPAAVEEYWEAAYAQSKSGQPIKIGHTHTTSQRGDDGQWTSTRELRLEVRRDSSVAEIKADAVTIEENSKVRATATRIWLGRDRIQTITGRVIEGPLWEITAQGGTPRTIRFEESAVGFRGERDLLKANKAKPGDKLTYRYFEGQVGMYITVRVSVEEPVEVRLPGLNPAKYLKVIAKPDPLDDGKNRIQMPASTIYADPATLEVIANVMEIPGLGDVTTVRTAKSVALSPNGQLIDLMRNQSIYLAEAIPDLHARSSARYQIQYEGDHDPKNLVTSDTRQSLKELDLKTKTFLLDIQAVRKPGTIQPDPVAVIGEEFLRSNSFVNSNDALVKKLARQATGKAEDPLVKARAIERFVFEYMRPVNFSEAMAPADHVAKTREGDCTEYSMLTAAMCRAVGVPSRTAIGLVYVNNLGGKPAFGFHMWTEVNIAGQWLGIDATLAQGSIGPGHIKICDESWDKVVAFNPLLPVQAFLMAKPKIKVLSSSR